MKSMNELVSGVKVNKSNKAKEYAKSSEWPTCTATGCPLPTTIKESGCTCTYHYKAAGFEAECITEAIKEFHPYIKKYNQMIFWNVKTWNERRASILGWPVLPATELEMDLPTLYLWRFKKWINTGLRNKATEIYQGN